MASHNDDVKVLVLWRCPFAMRALIGLQAKGIPHQVIHEDLSNKSELLLKSNPIHKKVPVLIHNGKVIIESLIILEYLDEAWPADRATGRPGFLPQDPYQRSQQRFWADFISNKFQVAMYRVRASTDEAAKEAANKEFGEYFRILDETVAKCGEFFGGETLGLADIALAPAAVFVPLLAEVSGLNVPPAAECPHLSKWFERIRGHPATQGALPEIGKLKEAILEQLAAKK